MIAIALLLLILMLWVANAKPAHFILVHGPDNQNIVVNVDEITNMRKPQEKTPKGHFPLGTQCLLFLTNGNFIAVQENCADITNQVEKPPQ
jgi:hypothetical protein